MKASELVERGDYFSSKKLYEEAYVCYLEAALSEKDGDAFYELGRMYLYGRYVDRDYAKAFKYFRISFDITGSSRGMIDIMLNEYDEITSDKEGRRNCRNYFDYMLEHGEFCMYVTIGCEYGIGRLYDLDYQRKIDYMYKAIEKGYNIGYDIIAEMYFEGKGVEQNYEKAYEFLMQYKGKASTAKPFILAEMYRCGLYLKTDIDKAMDLYRSVIDDFDEIPEAPDEYYQRACEIIKKMKGETN